MRVVDTIFRARDDAALIGVLSEIPGGADLLAWFGGHLPSFHDAEILGLELDRVGATCRIRAHTWEISDEVDKTGHFVSSRHVVASFELGGVTELSLEGFNHQNVIFGLFIERSDNAYRIELSRAMGSRVPSRQRRCGLHLSPAYPPTVGAHLVHRPAR